MKESLLANGLFASLYVLNQILLIVLQYEMTIQVNLYERDIIRKGNMRIRYSAIWRTVWLCSCGDDMNWINIDNEKPKDDSKVIAADIGHGEIYEMAACWFLHNRFRVHDGLEASNFDGGAIISIDFKITHWCYLPDVPK